MRAYQTSKVLLTQREHNLPYLILPAVDKTRHICSAAAWLLSLHVHEQQGWCCLTDKVHQRPLIGSQPSSDLFENAGPSTRAIQDSCWTSECCLGFALRVEGIYMICGILPFKFCYSNSFSDLCFSMCMDSRRVFFSFFGGGLVVHNNCPQTFFSAGNLKKLQGYRGTIALLNTLMGMTG